MTSRALHFEIPIDDPDRATAFYRALFGWEPHRWGESPYWNVADDPAQPGIAGALAPRAEGGDGVLIYVGVDDIDAALERASAAGGGVASPKSEVPGVGWVARVRDTEGNVVGLLQPAMG